MFNNKTILSLFTGAGFLDLGFINAGFCISEAVEIEPWFIEGYNYAFSNMYTNHKLIENPIDLSKTEVLTDLCNRHTGELGIVGGPPCQDFSVGGKNSGINGLRGRLLNSYLTIVKNIKPKFLFFENVPGLLNTKEHRLAFDVFLMELQDNGYSVWFDIINALDYGVPQDRPRVILVAFSNEVIEKLLLKGYILETDNAISQTTDIERKSRQIFRWPEKQYPCIKDKPWPLQWPFKSKKHCPKDIIEYSELMVKNAFSGITEHTPNQKDQFNPKSSKFTEVNEGDVTKKSFKRLHRFRYSPTVAYGHNEVHLHPTEPRRISVREGLRLQTVPDEYIWPDDIPLSHKFKMISNGVPTKLSFLIAKEIHRTINLFFDQESNG